jgi:hypothetical protein
MFTTGQTHSLALTTALFIGAAAHAQAPIPKNGFAPDKETAIRIVEAILPPICGSGCAARNQPFNATLNNGVWTVSGNPPRPAGQRGGGMIEVHVDQHTGAVLSYVFAR